MLSGKGRTVLLHCDEITERRGPWSAPRTAAGAEGAATLVNPLLAPLFVPSPRRPRQNKDINQGSLSQPGFVFGSKAVVRSYYLNKVHLIGFQIN